MTAGEEYSDAVFECFALNAAMESPEVSSLTLEVLCKYDLKIAPLYLRFPKHAKCG